MSSIIDHTHPVYKEKWANSGFQRYNGAYYYSIEIVNNIIPHVKTDRNWVTVNIPKNCFDHSIVFIHNNKNPERYAWLREFKDLILVCGVPETCNKVKQYGTPIYLPLSVDVAEIEKHKRPKVNYVAFAGRKPKRNGILFSPDIDFIENLPRDAFLDKLAEYEFVYAVGRVAIEAKVLGCTVLSYDPRYPNPSMWKILNNREAAKILQHKIDEIDNIKR